MSYRGEMPRHGRNSIAGHASRYIAASTLLALLVDGRPVVLVRGLGGGRLERSKLGLELCSFGVHLGPLGQEVLSSLLLFEVIFEVHRGINSEVRRHFEGL